MSSRGVIDLRPSRGRKPPRGQTSLFSSRPRYEPPKKPLPLRARRRRVRLSIAFALLLLIAGVAWGVHALSYASAFSIQEVVVTGTKRVPPTLVREYVGTVLHDASYHFFSRSNIFLYPRAVIERDVVADFPRVAGAKVSRQSFFSHELLVAITERAPYALWCLPAHAGQVGGDEGACFEMDDGGFIFAEASGVHEAFSEYIFLGGLVTDSPIGQTFAATHLPSLVALLTGLGQAGFSPSGASVESATDFTIPLGNDFVLKAPFGANSDTLIKNLQLVLSSDTLTGKRGQLEYVDLRFGDRVYYKLKGEEQHSQ